MFRRDKILAAWICFLGGFFVLYQFLIQGSTSLMVHQLMDNLCLNLTQIGFLSSAFFYPYILLQIPSGILVDKFGPKKTLFVATVILALSTFAFSFSDGFMSANLSRIIMGIASAPGVACAMFLAARWFPKHFAIVAGLLEMMGMLGGALGDFFLEMCIHQYGWRVAMIISAIIGIILAILILIFVRTKSNSKAENVPTKKQDPHTIKHFVVLIKNIEVWKHCLFGGCIFAIISAFASLWSIGFLQALYPDHMHSASFATAFIFIGAAIGAGLSGYLGNKFGCKIIMQLFSIVALIVFIILLYIPVSFIMVNVLLLILGVSSGAYILPFASIEAIAHKDAQGVAMGFTNMIIIGLGGPILQPVIGWILGWYQNAFACNADSVQSFQSALMPLLICLGVAVLLSFFVRRRKQHA
ncbi:MFS transporter [Fangia hongkongensis]|uniref:MFS transporter n=1 Tax=Fangia hongkongensis TaxID=270495 RepID=UPI000375B778|nr:MFS transporter [Fangia hongkongensis]